MGRPLHFGGTLKFAGSAASCFSLVDVNLPVCKQRITEIAGVVLSFDPKPIQVSQFSFTLLSSSW